MLKSRKAKDNQVSTRQLLAEWQQRGNAYGFRWAKVINAKHARPQRLRSEQDYRCFYRDVTQHLSKKESRGRLNDHQVMGTILSCSRGRLSQGEAQQMARGMKTQFLNTHPQRHGTTVYSLNRRGINAMGYCTPGEWLHDTCKGLKQAQYQNRMAILYATGRISGKQYRQWTQGKGLPKSTIGIRTHQALGLISKKQADYLVQHRHQPPRQQPQQPKPWQRAEITSITTYPPCRPQPQPTQPER